MDVSLLYLSSLFLLTPATKKGTNQNTQTKVQNLSQLKFKLKMMIGESTGGR